MDLLDLALYNLDDDPFEERPADLKDFLYKDEYCNFTKQGVTLSDEQELLVDLMSQVYKRKDLIRLFGEDRGNEIYSHTKKEIIMMLGKGAGKDFTSTVGCAYLVHKLLCLRDPAKYFGKPTNNAIDIINIPINAQQANNVFFKGFAQLIEDNPWFNGKYDKKMGQVAFNKKITVHSGHSERESWEGYNVILVILDEIAGFAVDSNSGNENAKTADAVYDMYAASVLSRFPDVGKIVSLSFPRYEGDFITKRYEQVIKTKEVVIKTHTFKFNPELPDGIPENELEIEWEEDHILTYDEPDIFALKRPSWDINPTKNVDMYLRAYLRDPVDAGARFACMPPKAIDAFFKSETNVEAAFARPDDALDEMNRLRDDFKPIPDMDYFIHVDLAQKHDHAAVALSHVGGWGFFGGGSEKLNRLTNRGAQPRIVVDLVKYWTPRSDQPIDLKDVYEFILELNRAGFRLKLVTFDRWNSTQTIEDLKTHGIKAEILSVALPHYTDFLIAVNESRVDGPDIPLLKKEMLQLRIMKNNKVDHPRKGSKDLSDATAGAIYNAAKYSIRSSTGEIEVYTMKAAAATNTLPEPAAPRKAPPGTAMPRDLEDFIKNMRAI
jgi:hypothetical protein